jgi:diacylglycerol kinase family enzyme
VTPSAPPVVTRGQRAAAIIALAALGAAVLVLVVAAVNRWPVLLASVATMSLVIIAAWYVVSRRGVVRVLAAVLVAAGLVCFVVVVVVSDSLRVLVVSLLLAAVSIAAARHALHRSKANTSENPSTPARHPVLLMNPKSGGGKAERFGLADHCLRLGIEPIVLLPGDDLLALAEEAVAGGADLIGMAGGDGSQALVASVASRRGVPFVVVPAGTRNHFALDLGIDREDVPGSLAAFRDGVDVTIDLAEVNGRVFVNNAAIGVYATIVQSHDYRDAKVQTVANMLPDLLGPTAEPSDVRYTLPSGDERPAGQLLLVSNNPYHLHHLRGASRRARLDRGVLGAVSVTVSSAADVETLTALELAGRVSQFGGWQEWTAAEIEVRSSRPVEIGVDGEALLLEPPLRFASRPAALTVRLPRSALTRAQQESPVRITERSTIVALWQIAAGSGRSAR